MENLDITDIDMKQIFKTLHTCNSRLLSAMAFFSLTSSIFAQAAVISNDLVKREIQYSGGHIITSSYRLVNKGVEFLAGGSPEFSFLLDGKQYTGQDEWTDFALRDTITADGGNGIILSFSNPDKTFRVSLSYVAWPGLPLINKRLSVENTGGKDIKLEGVDVEFIRLNFDTAHSRTFHHYGRHQTFGTYEGDWDDPLVIIHESACSGTERGVAVGNETVGVIKRTAVFRDGDFSQGSVESGLTHPESDYPFRRWLCPGESWTSAAIFTVLYEGDSNPQRILSTSVQDYVRKYMGVRIEQISQKPTFVYNTWIPFGRNVSEAHIMELADAAAACGVKEFVIDDGWQTNEELLEGHSSYLGDWVVDKAKFPNGLKPVFDHIKSLGMKPGLWISICGNHLSSKPYTQHPEWMVRDAQGRLANLHGCFDDWRTACLGTDWYDYIRDKILFFVREYGLAYVKLDFAIATSAYVYDTTISGCYATNHPSHRDWQESFDVIYERCMKLFDELHSQAPDLFIDCTYESAGKHHLMDYGIARHAEGNWLSNIVGPNPHSVSMVRSLAWTRTPALPATSLVIGNLAMEDPDAITSFKALAGTLPIMLGDPRQLSPERQAEFRKWSEWLQQMEEKHQVMSFRQDIPGMGEPTDGAWDGFLRINTETKSGGIVGVFRGGAVEKQRTIVVPWLNPEGKYEVRIGAGGRQIGHYTGRQLAEEGFSVTVDAPYCGELVEIMNVSD